MTSNRDDTSDAFGNARFFCNYEIFDVSCPGNMPALTTDVCERINWQKGQNSRSAAEFDARISPLLVLDVLSDVIDAILQRNDPDRIWI